MRIMRNNLFRKKTVAGIVLASALGMWGCGNDTGVEFQEPVVSEVTAVEEEPDYAELFSGLTTTKTYKGFGNCNPIFEQHYGADPFVLVYDDTAYIYMTADAYEYDGSGDITDNTYSQIKSIYVVSTKDMINFTDHGEIAVAGHEGAAVWAHNSWAPAVAWKEIDGKDKFFLYFADNGGGIGVLSADSPLGPFTDELGQGLIRRDMENCGNVEWLFDPAVFTDDGGLAYLYFGGGVPQGKADHPMTARCARLGDDMMSIEGVPVTIDAPYIFEDSGIHKYGDKYYYTYCSNFNVDEAGESEYGFSSGEIVMMESDSPLGPFECVGRIMKNPGYFFGVGGNNHHAIFEFQGRWYIAYHTRLLEKAQDILKGYRSTSIDEISIAEDGSIKEIVMTKNGRSQTGWLDPYGPVNAATFAISAGISTAPADQFSEEYGCGNMLLSSIDSGDFVMLQGVDFGETGSDRIRATVRTNGHDGVIRMTAGYLNKDVVCYIPVSGEGESVFEASFEAPLTGVQDIYFTFSGEGYDVLTWEFLPCL
jgi:arabinoxylan arabinofuranohydrolase